MNTNEGSLWGGRFANGPSDGVEKGRPDMAERESASEASTKFYLTVAKVTR